MMLPCAGCWPKFCGSRIERKRGRSVRLSFRNINRRFITAGPVCRQNSGFHIMVESRKRPIRHPPDQPMFHGVPMAIVNMAGKVEIVSYDMLPEAPLPHAPLTPCHPYLGAPFGAGNRPDEAYLDGLPAVGKIVVSRWQRPHAMHVIRQHHPSVDVKRSIPACHAHRLA